GFGVFHPSLGWRGCSPASAFPYGAQAANWPNDAPAKQYGCAGNARATPAIRRRPSIGLMQCPLPVFPISINRNIGARNKRGPNFGLGLFRVWNGRRDCYAALSL